MNIQQAILHILDKDAGHLLLSQRQMKLDNLLIQDYINKLCKKIGQGALKCGYLDDHSSLANLLLDETQDFVEKSKYLADKIYQCIAPAEQVPAADYLFFEAKDEVESVWFGIIRLDYASQFTHFLNVEEGMVNQLILNQAILPATSQTPSEAALINLTTGEYQLVEKQYVIEGKKTWYFSQQILEVEPSQTTASQIKAIKKTVMSVAKEFGQEPYEVLAIAQQEIHQQIENEQKILPTAIAQRVFQDNVGAQVAVQTKLDKQQIAQEVQVTNPDRYEKKYSKQKFKLANGIELMVPVELYGNSDVIEFINHPDGTISVMIKNVAQIMNTFNG